MKIKSFLVAVALIAGIAVVNAQGNQMWVGGSVAAWSQKVGDADGTFSYKVAPEFGYILNEKMAVGGRIGFIHSEDFRVDRLGSLGAPSTEEADGFTISPFFRYSLVKAGPASMFVDAGIEYTQMKGKVTSTKTNLLEIGFRPGIAVPVTKCIGLTAKVGFLGYENIKHGSVKSNGFGLDFDLNRIELGFNYAF